MWQSGGAIESLEIGRCLIPSLCVAGFLIGSGLLVSGNFADADSDVVLDRFPFHVLKQRSEGNGNISHHK